MTIEAQHTDLLVLLAAARISSRLINTFATPIPIRPTPG
jgi:hypothetical protein